jgi:hypothetical protein
MKGAHRKCKDIYFHADKKKRCEKQNMQNNQVPYNRMVASWQVSNNDDKKSMWNFENDGETFQAWKENKSTQSSKLQRCFMKRCVANKRHIFMWWYMVTDFAQMQKKLKSRYRIDRKHNIFLAAMNAWAQVLVSWPKIAYKISRRTTNSLRACGLTSWLKNILTLVSIPQKQKKS